MGERDLVFLMGLYPRLNQNYNLFDRNIIHLIQSFAGDAQLNFEHKHEELFARQQISSCAMDTDVDMEGVPQDSMESSSYSIYCDKETYMEG
jgi:hypothetical protein